MQIITPAQCRAARALLNWSQPELAKRCDIHVQTISNFEKENSTPNRTTLEKITNVLETANIQFIEKDGVRIKSTSIAHFSGKNGFSEFYEDIYKTIKKSGGAIQVANADEILFTDWLGRENTMTHKQRMRDIWQKTAFSFQILIQEGDTRLAITEVAQYRWMQKARYSDIPFYIYGKKLAIILFEKNDVNVYVINNPDITEAYQRQFKVIWDQSMEIPEHLHSNMKQFEV